MSYNYQNPPDRTAEINQRLADTYFQYHNPYSYNPPQHKYCIVKTAQGDRVEECRTVVVHEFTVSEVYDPDLYAAEPLIAWQDSAAGQWVMRNSADTPTWHRSVDVVTYGYKYKITAKLTGSALTEWLLKYGVG